MQTRLDDFLRGIDRAFPHGRTFGGIASTVSSLSRARLLRGSQEGPALYGDGCVGLAMRGDIRADVLVAQGAKPVGGVYRVVAAGERGGGSTIGAIVADEAAHDDPGADEGRAAEGARIPKPPLAEANFLMRRLSDDDRAFMRRALLIGIERGGPIGRTPDELKRLAEGKGHRFTVRQVASAGMKDGSVTFPLGSVDVRVGTRCRFFVRDGDFAKKEVEALWTGYKKRELEGTLSGGGESSPTGCMLFSTLDRGSKLFGGKTGYESGVVSEFLPRVPSVSGFFANGVLGKLDGAGAGPNENMLHGSASCYVVFRSSELRMAVPRHRVFACTLTFRFVNAAIRNETTFPFAPSSEARRRGRIPSGGDRTRSPRRKTVPRLQIVLGA